MSCAKSQLAIEKANLVGLIGNSFAIVWKDWPTNMQLSSIDQNQFVLNGTCPHCLKEAAFVTVTGVFEERASELIDMRRIAAAQCIACHEYILAILSTVEAGRNAVRWVYNSHYPLGRPNDAVSDDIPTQVRSDFQEAIRAEWIKAYKAAVLMCRRSLQTSCDLEGAKGNDLYNQIDDLSVKQKITQPLKDMAHRIRLLGKKGAHGDYSDIDDTITPEDAADAITFMRHYFEHVYVLPAKLSVPLKGAGKKPT